MTFHKLHYFSKVFLNLVVDVLNGLYRPTRQIEEFITNVHKCTQFLNVYSNLINESSEDPERVGHAFYSGERRSCVNNYLCLQIVRPTYFYLHLFSIFLLTYLFTYLLTFSFT